MSKWISVKDRLPIEQDYKSTLVGRDVLITDGYKVKVCEFQMGGNHIGIPWRSFSTLSSIER